MLGSASGKSRIVETANPGLTVISIITVVIEQNPFSLSAGCSTDTDFILSGNNRRTIEIPFVSNLPTGRWPIGLEFLSSSHLAIHPKSESD
jgi:hypothetical protein